jgi:hypothetical protein
VNRTRLLAVALLAPLAAAAQDSEPHSGHDEHAVHDEAHPAGAAEHAGHSDHADHAEPAEPAEPAEHAEHAQHSADHGTHEAMTGALGHYPMTREASGTSWQPETSPLLMRHRESGSWSLMTEGSATAVYTDAEAGTRGDHDAFVESMGMLMAQRPSWRGTAALRAMLSLDPALVGDDGYPLLFQTGETADGVTPLVDRQHPHDLFMELAASYSIDFGALTSRGSTPGAADSGHRRSLFVYAGLPGEPALGPATYMHRASGMKNPEAPISHHWLDSTHVTFGVLTGGLVLGDVKLEASAFNGREPDEHRYDIETGSIDSWSVRATWNPTISWSMQASYGVLDEPERLEPGVDIDRTTVSATYHSARSRGWYTTFAAGRNSKQPGAQTDAYLLESNVELAGGLALFARAESVEKDELFAEGDPLHGAVFKVRKLGLGAETTVRDLWRGNLAVGVVYDFHFTPRALDAAYGNNPHSWLVYARWSLQ